MAVVYGAVFGLTGISLPYFPVWLKAIGVDVGWIGIITAMPALTRFTVLPLVTGFAERRRILRQAIVALAFLTSLGFLVVGQFPSRCSFFWSFCSPPASGHRSFRWSTAMP